MLIPEAINDIFRKSKQVPQYNTRQKNDLHPVKINTKFYGEKTISSKIETIGIISYPTTLQK